MKSLRVFIMLVVALVILCGTCFAEQWDKINKTEWVDLDSIKTIQVDYDDVIKYTLKCDTGQGYLLLYELANNDKRKECIVLMEDYDSSGKLLFSLRHDPKNPKSWRDWTSSWPEIKEVLKRAK